MPLRHLRVLRHEYQRHGETGLPHVDSEGIGSSRQNFDRPAPNFPIIKDLVVDMSPFWDKIRAVTPWVTARHASQETVWIIRATSLLPDTYQFHNVDACIMCGACVAACTSHEVSREFLGPAALAKAERFVADPREPAGAKQARLTALQESHGMWDCTRCNMCVQVCPKDVQPMEAIIRLRRSALQHGLTSTEGARHITGFVDLVRHEGRLNEALMPLKVLGMNLRRLLSVFRWVSICGSRARSHLLSAKLSRESSRSAPSLPPPAVGLAAPDRDV